MVWVMVALLRARPSASVVIVQVFICASGFVVLSMSLIVTDGRGRVKGCDNGLPAGRPLPRHDALLLRRLRRGERGDNALRSHPSPQAHVLGDRRGACRGGR